MFTYSCYSSVLVTMKKRPDTSLLIVTLTLSVGTSVLCMANALLMLFFLLSLMTLATIFFGALAETYFDRWQQIVTFIILSLGTKILWVPNFLIMTIFLWSLMKFASAGFKLSQRLDFTADLSFSPWFCSLNPALCATHLLLMFSLVVKS